MLFPDYKGRRLRLSKNRILLSRNVFVSETDFIMPVFVENGKNIKKIIKNLPEIYIFSPDTVHHEIQTITELGIPAVLLFFITSEKDDIGSSAESSFITQTILSIKQEFPDLLLFVDVCLCEFTLSGHCGIVKNNHIDNELSIQRLAEIALTYAKAGADFVAPSAMMDGQVKAIRTLLDENDFMNTGILSYSVKFASNLYFPFREVMNSAPAFGDRTSYQLDFGNNYQYLQEVESDIKEGADMIMVKPSLFYLDIVSKIKENFHWPLAVYNVSGEYALLYNMIQTNSISKKSLLDEFFLSYKRAGADIIITYFAKDYVTFLKDN